MPRFSLGWKRQPHDPRDWRFHAPHRLTRMLAPSVDLSAGMGPLLDQGDIGSCGPNTADECIEYDQRAEKQSVVSASRLFIYYTTRQLMGTVGQDSGVDNRTLLKALAQYGYCAETLWPYDTSKFTLAPPQSVYSAALANRISNYAAVTQSPDQMKGCLSGGFPFMFGFTVYPGIQSDAAAATGIVPDPQPGEQSIGGHDVTFCGYDDAGFGKILGGAFKFRNHWTVNAQPWGDGGYGYISYKYALDPNQAGDFWVINAIPTGTTPNPPGPGPGPTPHKILSLTFPRDIHKGSMVRFAAPVSIAAGTYDMVSESASAAALAVSTES